ncbi:MAG: aminotransferase class IV [Arcicella sp.]|nr:aminotransferase class IV [Arcicella sp.]
MQLLETIYLKDSQLQNIDYHNQRFNEARKSLFGNHQNVDLRDLIKVSEENKTGDFRCRVIYGDKIESINFIKYSQKEIKNLRIVDVGNWEYDYKYADRGFLSNLLENNADVDEVIMTKNGFITDCTIANLAFYDGKDWFTPSTPMLRGTKRQQLLDRQLIVEREIRVNDLKNYEGVCLINCFRNLELENLIRI